MKASRRSASLSRGEAARRPPGKTQAPAATRETFSSFVRNLARLEAERTRSGKAGAPGR